MHIKQDKILQAQKGIEIACDSFNLINLTSCGTRQITQQSASTLDKTKTAISIGLIIYSFFLAILDYITIFIIKGHKKDTKKDLVSQILKVFCKQSYSITIVMPGLMASLTVAKT